MAAVRPRRHSGFLHKVITAALQAGLDTPATHLLLNPAEDTAEFNLISIQTSRSHGYQCGPPPV